MFALLLLFSTLQSKGIFTMIERLVDWWQIFCWYWCIFHQFNWWKRGRHFFKYTHKVIINQFRWLQCFPFKAVLFHFYWLNTLWVCFLAWWISVFIGWIWLMASISLFDILYISHKNHWSFPYLDQIWKLFRYENSQFIK